MFSPRALLSPYANGTDVPPRASLEKLLALSIGNHLHPIISHTESYKAIKN